VRVGKRSRASRPVDRAWDRTRRRGRGAGLVGRDAELAALTACCARAADGRGGLTIVEGEQGIGASALIAEVTRRAAATGFAVLTARAEPPPLRPLGVLAELLASSDVLEPHLTAFGGILGRHEDGAGGRGVEPAPDRRLVVQDLVVDALEQLDRPVVVVIEDCHHADPATVAVLAGVARRLAGMPVALVVTTHPGAPAGAIADAVAAGDVSWLRLTPLSDDDLVTIAAHIAGGRPGPRLRAALAGTGGNPLICVQLIAALAQEGRLAVEADGVEVDGHGDVPRHFADRLARRTAGLPPRAAEAVRAAAVIGACAPAELAAVLGRHPWELGDDLAAATDAGLLDPRRPEVAFRHPVVQDAIATTVPAAVRATLHHAAGEELARRGASALRVAHHLALGSAPVDVEAATWLRRAGREVRAQDPAWALALVDRALAALPALHPLRPAFLADRADVLVSLARYGEAEAAAATALTARPAPAVEARLRSTLGRTLALAGSPSSAVEHFDAAITAACDDSAERSRLRADAATVRLWAFDLRGAAEQADLALTEARRLGDPIATTGALNVVSRLAAFRADVGAAVTAGEEAVRCADTCAAASRTAAHLYLGLALMNADRLGDARDVLGEGRRHAELAGAAWALPKYESALALVSFFAGDWDDAVVHGAVNDLVAADTGQVTGHGQLQAIAGLVALHRGQPARAAACAEAASRAMARPGADASGLPYVRWLEALLAEAGGDDERAVEILRGVCDLALGVGVPLVVLWLAPDLARLAGACRRTSTVEWLAAELAPVAATAGTASARAAAAFVDGVLTGAPDRLDWAAATWASMGRRPDAARAAELAGRLALEAGDIGAGTNALRVAQHEYDLLGAERRSRDVRARLRDAGVRPGVRGLRRRPHTGWAALTPTEVAVARLVADGATNGQIAAALVVSKRTVETHLSSLYRKLGVSTRVAIANIVARQPGDTPERASA
jgi:DNA-binding CsgD family transcriptional regulator/tetratricopeptide (TPR) repeat protein